MSASAAERLAAIQDRLRARKFISEAITTVMHALDAALHEKDAEIARLRTRNAALEAVAEAARAALGFSA